ncbi:MAG: GTPase Era [bacterium]
MSTPLSIKPPPEWPLGHVGFVALLGRPNTGKSTLLNSVLDYHLAAVSPRPQTTRRRLLGVYSTDGMQALFLDTPGVHAGGGPLDEAMQEGVRRALHDADVVVLMADPTRLPGQAEDQKVLELAIAAHKPVILVLNKRDVTNAEQQEAVRAFFAPSLPPATPVVHISALNKGSLGPLLAAIRARLPEGPFLYPADMLTDTIERHVGAELIREVLLDLLSAELPHAIAVEIEAWKELHDQREISAVLHVERDSQKRIVIGEGGRMIKQIRDDAKKKLAELCGAPVHLDLWVKVSDDWRKNKNRLGEFGLLPGFSGKGR